MDFKAIVDSLRHLSPKQLVELRALANVMLKAGPADAAPMHGPQNDADLLLVSIVEFMRNQGYDSTSFAVLRRQSFYPSFAEKATSVMAWLREITEERAQLDKLIRLSLGFLWRDCSSWTVVDTRTMMSFVHRIPALWQWHFPGYKEEGMLVIILRQIIVHQTESE